MTPDLKRSCPVCGGTQYRYLFMRHGVPVLQCEHCGLTGIGEPPASHVPPGLEQPEAAQAPNSAVERKAADALLAALAARGMKPSRMLAIASESHPALAAATARGFTIAARTDPQCLDGSTQLPPADCAIVMFQLERTSNPVRALERLHVALAPGGMLAIVAPSLDSWHARMLGRQWPDWRSDSRWYFDTQTIQSTCLRAGFAEIEWSRGGLPGARIITARRVERAARPLLSIVMPVFNERATFEQTLASVLEKDCQGIDKEIVIVESASTDGTHEVVKQYENRPGIRVIYEDRPRGKGAAVRTGLSQATGTVVLIQDADSEYDVNDYDALIEPVVTFQRAFVLGSRHMGNWKVREFADQPVTSAFFNAGHVLFRTALNLLYGQRLNDPFTMYKVFRRDCLHGLRFECNRFDFDFELVIKLLRKGYVPLEVPVNYVSRSFKDGKKVSAWRDPVTWIRALVKYRFASIYDEPPR